jgi:hypothetical protein
MTALVYNGKTVQRKSRGNGKCLLHSHYMTTSNCVRPTMLASWSMGFVLCHLGFASRDNLVRQKDAFLPRTNQLRATHHTNLQQGLDMQRPKQCEMYRQRIWIVENCKVALRMSFREFILDPAPSIRRRMHLKRKGRAGATVLRQTALLHGKERHPCLRHCRPKVTEPFSVQQHTASCTDEPRTRHCKMHDLFLLFNNSIKIAFVSLFLVPLLSFLRPFLLFMLVHRSPNVPFLFLPFVYPVVIHRPLSSLPRLFPPTALTGCAL